MQVADTSNHLNDYSQNLNVAVAGEHGKILQELVATEIRKLAERSQFCLVNILLTKENLYLLSYIITNKGNVPVDNA